MKKLQTSDTEFMERVNRHLVLKERVDALFRVADASIEGLVRADDVEIKIRDGLRDLGKNIIEDWAKNSELRLAVKAAENKDMKKHSKKNSIGTQLLDQ